MITDEMVRDALLAFQSGDMDWSSQDEELMRFALGEAFSALPLARLLKAARPYIEDRLHRPDGEIDGSTARLLNEVDAALSAALSEPQVKVKPLEWQEESPSYITSSFGYHIEHRVGTWMLFSPFNSEEAIEVSRYPEPLKAAAQADYEARILSALSVERESTAQSHAPQPNVNGEPVRLTYTNWRGETSERTIKPIRIYWGSSEWHPEPQWLLTAFDIDKNAERDFALKDFGRTHAPFSVGHKAPRWRVFEDITHGWWGIEEAIHDGNTILYPKKVNREALEGIVRAHNAALTTEGEA